MYDITDLRAELSLDGIFIFSYDIIIKFGEPPVEQWLICSFAPEVVRHLPFIRGQKGINNHCDWC